MKTGTNAQHCKPEFEGQIVKFKSPHSNAILFDIAVRNEKYGYLEWYALNEPTDYQRKNAFWAD